MHMNVCADISQDLESEYQPARLLYIRTADDDVVRENQFSMRSSVILPHLWNLNC